MKAEYPDSTERTDTMDLRTTVLVKLAKHGIGEVRIEFDGSGDDGQIDSITCTTVNGQAGSLEWPCEIPETILSSSDVSWSTCHAWIDSGGELQFSRMRSLLEDWAYALLDQTGVDWVNEDGGYGTIVIVPAEDAIRCEINTRFVDIETSEHEF
jgi:hypothetical protein